MTELPLEGIKTRSLFSDRIHSFFRQDQNIIIKQLNEIDPSVALALYGISDENSLFIAKNKTIILLFESSDITENWNERNHPEILKVS